MSTPRHILLASLIVLTPAASVAAPAGDAVRGKARFAMCSACHDASKGTNGVGPTLKGIVSRRAGTVPGYSYSPALKAKQTRWTAKTLDAFLTAPARFAPGTRMPLAVAAPQDRADLIAYLATLK